MQGHIGFGLQDLQNLIDYLINNLSIETGIDTGTTTGAGAATLTDVNKNWAVNALVGSLVKITEGAGAGQLRVITSNTATQITVASNWATIPAAGHEYSIISMGSGGTPSGVYESSYEQDFSVGAALSVDLDTGENGGRSCVNIYLTSSVDATWFVSVSSDNVLWHIVDELEVEAGVAFYAPYSDNAWRYIRVATAAVGNHTAEIVASR